MKHLFVLFFLLVSLLPLSAQDWLPEGSQWYFTNSVFSFQTGVNVYALEGVEEKLGQTCRVLTKADQNCDLRPTVEYLYEEDDQLYFFDEKEEKFKLLYDFSAEVGDTVKVPLWEYMYPLSDDSTLHYVVDSMGSLLLDTLELKTWQVRYGYRYDGMLHFETWPTLIIENIGSTHNFFHLSDNGGCDATHTHPLRCFDHPGLGRLRFTTAPCETLVSIQDQQVAGQGISLFPNPARQELTLEVQPGAYARWEIRDLTGRIRQSGELPPGAGNLTLPLQLLDPGSYLFTLTNEEKGLFSHRIFVKI